MAEIGRPIKSPIKNNNDPTGDTLFFNSSKGLENTT